MKTSTKITVGVLLVLAVVAAVVVLFIRGMFGSTEVAHPPCDQLPTRAVATKALTEHQKLADEIRAVGKDVGVETHNPCSEKEDRALIKVTYGSESEQEAIENLIANRDGFGVPLYVVER